MRYGHQPISEIERLSTERLIFYSRHLGNLIDDENEANRKPDSGGE